MEKGTLSITENVFAIISSIVINEIEDIASTVSDIKDDFVRVVNKKGNQRGITIDHTQDQLTIDIKISVYYGACISEVCFDLQKKIKNEIEIMTGVDVHAVNVFVDSVKFRDQS